MTDNQTLLAEYARNGSDVAFRELVTCYVDLVYSTALRLPMMSDQDWISYTDRMMLSGEQAAMQWLFNKYGPK